MEHVSKIKHYSLGWRFLYVFGCMALFVSLNWAVNSVAMASVYTWLFLCSMVSFVISKTDYAVISIDGISFNTGKFTSSKALEFTWGEIADVIFGAHGAPYDFSCPVGTR